MNVIAARITGFVLLIACSLLLAAGCGSDDKGDDQGAKTQTQKPQRGFEAKVGDCEIKPKTQCPDAALSKKDLEGAHLEGANLSGANLRGANLRTAYLSGANLEEANLTGTNLFQADLVGANMRNAIVRGADLSDAALYDADLKGVDLKSAKTCQTAVRREAGGRLSC
jgi:uncharacterized protein YjbI with pentapeptide repeats